jgi:peptide/nickel transport system substrate-binding protein
MNRKCLKAIVLVGVVFLASIALANPWIGHVKSSGSAQPKYGGTLIVAQLFNPYTWTQCLEIGGVWWASFVLYDRLVEYDFNMRIYPGLAYRWEISPDGLTYTFHLYQNVTWHDGVKFTSADVKFTIEYVLNNTGFATPYYEKIDEVECPDDYTVVITLKEPDAPFLYKLGAWTGGTHMIAKHIFEGTDFRTNPAHTTHPIGTGPFKFKEFVSGDHYTLVAYENYFKGRPYLDQIVYKIIPERAVSLAALEAGEIHHTLDPPPFSELDRLKQIPYLSTHVRLGGDDSMILYFNLNRKPFDDKRVRQAILYAIDRKQVADLATFGYDKPAYGPYANWTGIDWAFNPKAMYPEYNPEKAEQLLDEAGYTRGPDGIRFKATLETLTIFPEMESAIMIIKEQLKKVGIEVDAKVIEYASFWDKVMVNHDFEMAVSVIYTVPDPYTLGDVAGTGGFDNPGEYSNPKVDELLKKALVPLSREERKPYYDEIQEILREDVPYILLVQYAWPFVWNNQFHGFYFEEETLGTRFDFRKVWWEGGSPLPSPSPALTPTPTPTPALTPTPTPTPALTPTPTLGPTFPVEWVAVAIIVIIIMITVVALLIKKRK